jgi:hypothetical protein
VVVLVVALIGAGGYELTKSGSSQPTVAPASAVTSSAAPTAHKPSTLPAATSLHQAIADALAKQSVRIVVKDRSAKHGQAVYHDDDASNGGIQRVSTHGGHVTIRLVNGVTYASGDQLGLTGYMGLSPELAAAVGPRWLSLSPGELGFAQISRGITLASSIHELGVGGSLRRLPVRRRDGRQVVGIAGTGTGKGVPKSARATLWISVGSDPLPVEFDARSGKTSEQVRLSNWGERVHVSTPNNLLSQS